MPTATVSFTNNGAETNLFDTAGARTFVFTGTNTGNNLFAIPLANQAAAATSVIKSGTGTWVLGTTGTATGTTVISNT